MDLPTLPELDPTIAKKTQFGIRSLFAWTTAIALVYGCLNGFGAFAYATL